MTDEAKRTVANRGTSARFRELLETNPGTVFYMKDLMAKLGSSEVAIQATAARCVKESNGRYQVHIPARAWMYTVDGANAATTKRMFEEIGTAKDGSVIIQDEAGAIYRAVEM